MVLTFESLYKIKKCENIEIRVILWRYSCGGVCYVAQDGFDIKLDEH